MKGRMRKTRFHSCPGWAVLAGLWVVSTAQSQDLPTQGGLLSDDLTCTAWWTGTVAKVMKDEPCPIEGDSLIRLWAASNEIEGFQLVIRPKIRMDNVRVIPADFFGPDGSSLPSSCISIRQVEYVFITKPTDSHGRTGYWPDPLPPVPGPLTLSIHENQPFWISVHVPKNTPAGLYRGSLTIAGNGWKKNVPVLLEVWNFGLPDLTHLRSSFGLNPEFLRLYHNLDTPEELDQVYDLYMQEYRDHRICPTSFMSLFPIKVRIQGLPWEGGEFVSDSVCSGKRSLKISDQSAAAAVEARTVDPIPLVFGRSYTLSWSTRSDQIDQAYTVLVESRNAEGRVLPYDNVLKTFKATKEWKRETMDIKGLVSESASAILRFFPTFRDAAGSKTGTVTFDDVSFSSENDSANLCKGGDFETDVSDMKVDLDFSRFDLAAHRYLDEFGFNAFDLALEGIGSGSFYSHQSGRFGGFPQGTAEYDTLMHDYLGKVQSHLEQNGWLGKEYIYWFDEPDPKDYPFVREGMINIRKAAPKLTRFITEHQPGPDIMDVSEISCTIWHRVDPKIVEELAAKGREFWSYLCCVPRHPWVSLFIDHDAINLRIWTWMSYQNKLKGILIWSSVYWNSGTASPQNGLQNPWKESMSYVNGYGFASGQIGHWGNGDGRLFYPPNRDPGTDRTKYLNGPIPSLRLEILREGIEDYEYFILLEEAIRTAPRNLRKSANQARGLLTFGESFFKSGNEYSKDPGQLMAHRAKIARAIVHLTSKSRSN